MLREDLQNALKEAMKTKDMVSVSAVRMIIAGMKEKDAASIYNKNYDDFMERMQQISPN